MKKLMLSVLCATMLSGAAFAACGGGGGANEQCCTISVRTNADKEVKADVATLNFTVETSDKDMNKASEKNRSLSDNVFKALKESLDIVKGDKLESANYSMRPTYNYDNVGKRHFDKYVVTNDVVVTTKNLENLGKLIDLGISKGATSISDLKFDLSDRTPYCNVLLKETAKSAQVQAKAIADGLGLTVTKTHKVLSSCSTQSVGAMNYRSSFGMAAAKLDQASTSIEAGSVRVWTDFTGEFRFK